MGEHRGQHRAQEVRQQVTHTAGKIDVEGRRTVAAMRDGRGLIVVGGFLDWQRVTGQQPKLAWACSRLGSGKLLVPVPEQSIRLCERNDLHMHTVPSVRRVDHSQNRDLTSSPPVERRWHRSRRRIGG